MVSSRMVLDPLQLAEVRLMVGSRIAGTETCVVMALRIRLCVQLCG